ncbi:PEP-CTERM sorting domain-containing protein [Crocosphaera sp. XPORK-15E]|uniref:PEP-CTERM sorting domain-containing protein n=1 Tax=Crocosphaera sp. XPORK-15E TaxID=3110247 RepID=UPI002B20135B|nr:PEP-CTERM sorting domain-containing protein [Crocosphaera sp. XPORK-15E]MEA5533797.1 PEP-CTERM sorting domain-containing protein [Crocosphaera sp. XPORK-15E]
MVTSTSEAQAATFDLSFTGNSTSITGTGTVTIDDVLLIPNQAFFGLTGITAFQATLTNLPTVPNSTTFSLADVSAFIIFTDSNASITDFNLASASNAGGFSAIGVDPFTFALQDQVGTLDTVTIGITPAATSVPEPDFLTMLGAVTVMGFGTAFKRKLAQKKQNKA